MSLCGYSTLFKGRRVVLKINGVNKVNKTVKRVEKNEQ